MQKPKNKARYPKKKQEKPVLFLFFKEPFSK